MGVNANLIGAMIGCGDIDHAFPGFGHRFFSFSSRVILAAKPRMQGDRNIKHLRRAGLWSIVEPKANTMKEEKVNELIVTFADYVENYCDRENTAEDVPAIVDEHFDEFIEWAFEDFVINEEDQDILKGIPDTRFRDMLKAEVVQEFQMILRLRKHKVLIGTAPL